MTKRDRCIIMTPEHPRWDEFLDRLEGPEGCNFREEDGEFEHDCPSGSGKPGAHAILKDMGFSDEAIEASFAYFESQGGYCDCEILLNISYHEEAYPVTREDRDPLTVRQIFKHLDDTALLKVANSLRCPDGNLSGLWGEAFAVALMQRGYRNEAKPYCDSDLVQPEWDVEMIRDFIAQLQWEHTALLLEYEHGWERPSGPVYPLTGPGKAEDVCDDCRARSVSTSLRILNALDTLKPALEKAFDRIEEGVGHAVNSGCSECST